MFGSKILTTPSPIFLAAAIIGTTFLAVLMYSTAVSRDTALLSEPDAPDFAYYLGFSLTVAALSLTFLVDLLVTSSSAKLGVLGAADASRGTMDRALAQFGAGLLATLFGLCAKIWLSSKQQRQAQDPALVATKFRAELADFSQLIRETSQVLATSIQNGCATINSASASAAQSMRDLSRELSTSADTLATSLNAEKLGSPVALFLGELDKLVTPVSSLRGEISSFSSEINKLSALVVRYEDALASGTTTLGLQQMAILESTTVTSTLSAAVASLNEETGKLEAKILATALAIESLQTPLTSLTPALDAAFSGTQQLKAASVRLTDSLISSDKAVLGQTGSIEKLAGTMDSARTSLQSLGGAVDEVDKSLKRGQEVITSWSDSLNRSSDSIRSTETAANNLGESFLETVELQKKTSRELHHSEQVISSLNGSLADLQDELKKVVGVLSLTQSSSLTLSSKFEPLASSAVQAELAVRLLRESLEATKGVLAALNTSADDLSRRLQGLGRGSGS